MEKKSVHDINKLPSDGYIVFPLSMSRLNNEQSAEKLYELIEFFEKKISAVGIDGIFLYTNGLYYNNNESALEVRKRTNGQMLSHKNAILKKVLKNKKFVPQSMHFLPWDYVVLNSPNYQEFFQILLKLKDKDKKFKELLVEGLKGREESEANINFLIEEIAVTHLIRQKMIEFPKTLVKQDKFRLIVYPGSYLNADLYQWKNKILPQNETADNKSNPFYASQYNSADKILCNFDDLDL
jgi:hypothetical protein